MASGNVIALLVFIIIFQSIIILLLYRKNVHVPNLIYPSSTNFLHTTKSHKATKNRSTLLELGMKYKTDKVFFHHYETLYEKYLESYREKSFKFLEIGLGCRQQAGVGASAKVWREYFGPLADIHLIEFDKQCGDDWYSKVGKDLNVTLHFGSQEDVVFLDAFTSLTKSFDIVIDDGGHQMKQQQTSFVKLVPIVKSGGLYVIEDLQTSLDAGAIKARQTIPTTLDMIKNMVEDVQHRAPAKKSPVAHRINSFEIGDNICFFLVK